MHYSSEVTSVMNKGILRNTPLRSDESRDINMLPTYSFLHGPLSRALPRRFRLNDPSGVSSELDDDWEAWEMGDRDTSALSPNVILITHQPCRRLVLQSTATFQSSSARGVAKVVTNLAHKDGTLISKITRGHHRGMRSFLEVSAEYQWIARKLAHENVDRDHRRRRRSHAENWIIASHDYTMCLYLFASTQ